MTTLPLGRAFTRDDLEAMPEDGHRYELIDGALVVTPSPSRLHQRAAYRVASLLDDACPRGWEMLMAPFDVALADNTVVQPDVVIAREADFTDRDLPSAPLLAVEILSPSTRLIDLTLKKARYQAAGCPSYWVIDPDEPSLLAWDLHDGEYIETARVTCDETFQAVMPFRVDVTPARLVR